MSRRIIAILLIWFCTTLAWVTLAGTMGKRDDTTDDSNRRQVEDLWGRSLRQEAPAVLVPGPGKAETSVPLSGSDLRVSLDLTHRKKGLQWYPTYRVTFAGTYRVKNPMGAPVSATVALPLPDERAIYDDFRFHWGETESEDITLVDGVVRQRVELPPNSESEFRFAYSSQGMGEWYYAFGKDARQVRDFSLQMDTNFEDIDFPSSGTSPTEKVRTDDGWRLAWKYGNLLSGVQIGMVMPERLNPGPWVRMVSSAAPVSLFLFFFLLFITSTLRGVHIHPMNYFFIAAAFFSYHLLLSYLVDHISIHLAFWICSAVSIFLVVSYMRLVLRSRKAVLEVALSQGIYLVLFSYTFFFQGFTGLAITILCIATLFVVMQMTGRLDWEAVFKGQPGRSGGPAPAAPPPPPPGIPPVLGAEL